VAALDRAVAFRQVDRVAVRVAEHLDFDVPRPLDQFFHQHALIAEAGRGFPPCRREGLVELARRRDRPHALAAAAGGGLEQHRDSPWRSRLRAQGLHRVLVVAVITGDQRYPGLAMMALARALEPMASMASAGGPMKDQAGGLAGVGRNPAFSDRKTVARVDRLGAAAPGRIEDALAQQVGAPGWRAPRRYAPLRRQAARAGHRGRHRSRRRRCVCPLRRAVAITRQAISPRLAISMRLNITAPSCPGRPALLQERLQALLALLRNAQMRDAGTRVIDQRRIDPAGPAIVADQCLGLAHGLRAVAAEFASIRLSTRASRSAGVAVFVDQADARREFGVEALAGQEQAARPARPDGLEHVRADSRGYEADTRFRESEAARSLPAIAISQQLIRPTAPPKALPCTRAMVGWGRVFRALSISARARASSRLWP
jgi:hypothetical protein